jgi:hypothetical protein
VKRFNETKLSPAEIRFLVLSILAVLVGVSAFLAANVMIAQRLDGGGGILLPWRAWRVYPFENGEPYDGATASFVQRQVYGRDAQAGNNPYILDMPFPLLLLYVPLGLFQTPDIVRGIYLSLSEAGLLALAYFSLILTDWQPRRLFTILFFIFSGLGLYSLLALLEATPAILLGLTYAGILLALRADLDELAGVLLGVSFLHWEIGAPFILLVLVRVLVQKRSRVFYGFFILMFLLTIVSFLVHPGWFFPNVVGVFANWRADFGLTSGAVFTRLWPEIGARLGWALTGLTVLILGWEWARARGADFRRFYWAACLTLAFTPLLGQRTALENLVVLIIPAALIFAIARERWKAGYWLGVALLAVFFSVPWILFLGGFVAAPLRNDLIFLFLPTITVIGLYWIRWWAIRPPRTWTERVARPEYQ